jgi:serine/threonine-protein kinase
MLTAESGLPRIAGYDVLRRLAVDATSDVLLARAHGPAGLERVVVLNVLIEPWRDDDEALRVLGREVEGYRRLTHPAVARLYDFLAIGGHRIVVLEYVDGLPLHRLRALLKTHGRALPDQAAVYISWRVFSALAAAHGALDSITGRVRSVVHKDVNPSHVLVPWDGHVKVGNFGIAVAFQHGDRVESGLLQGTYGYSAPEQAKGAIASPRSDVYSAGLLLWELLAGRKAIVRGSGHEASVVEAVAKAEFPPLHELRPDLPKTILTAVSRALEPDPDRRSIDAQSMCDVLRTSGNLEDGRVALVESLSVVRPPAVADMLFEAPSRSKVPSELWLEPTRKVDVPVYVGSARKADVEPASAVREPTNPPKEGAARPLSPPLSSRPPASVPPIVLRVGLPRPRDAGKPAPGRAPVPTPMSAPAPTPVSVPARVPGPAPEPTPAPALPPAISPVENTWFQGEQADATPLAPPRTPSFQPPPPSPIPPERALIPVVETPRRRPSPALWAAPAAVVVGAVIAARQPWKSIGPEPPTARQASSQGVEVPAPSIDRPGSVSSVRLVAPPMFDVVDAASSVVESEADRIDSSRPPLRPGTGSVTVGSARSGHRVWIDERLMGEESPASYVISCGRHVVRVGSHGAPQYLEVPCGADVEIK